MKTLCSLAIAAALGGCVMAPVSPSGYYMVGQPTGWMPAYPPPPTPPGATAPAAPAASQAPAPVAQPQVIYVPVQTGHVCYAGRNFRYCSTW